MNCALIDSFLISTIDGLLFCQWVENNGSSGEWVAPCTHEKMRTKYFEPKSLQWVDVGCCS